MSINVHNPFGVNQGVADFRDAVDSTGSDIETRNISWPFRANATIAKGEAIMTVAPTATVPVSVSPMTAAIGTSDPWSFAGIAGNAADAGETVQVIVFGYCRALLEAADSPAALNVLAVPDTAWSWLTNGYHLLPECLNDRVTWTYDHADSPWHVAFTPGMRVTDVVNADGEVLLAGGRPTRVDVGEVRAHAAEQATRLFALL